MACELGVYGLAVMGVNLALNAASKGFRVCVGNRTPSKVDAALQMAATQGLREKFVGAKDTKEFVGLAELELARPPQAQRRTCKSGKRS